jgi:hypothetical protein
MNNNLSSKALLILSTILLSIYPFFYVYVNNYGHIYLSEIVIPTSCSIIFNFFFLIVFLHKGIQKSHVLSSLIFMFIMLYGHFKFFVPIFTGIYFFVPYFFLLIYIIIYIYFSKKDFKRVSKFIVKLSIILIFINSTFLILKIDSEPIKIKNLEYEDGLIIQPYEKPKDYHDIYYIVLDTYPSKDILLNVFNFDNSAFYDSLESLGFRINHKSLSNYSQTLLSLCSILNLEYIDDLAGLNSIKNSSSSKFIHSKIKNNRLINFLKNHDYNYIHFSSGWSVTDRNEFSDQIIDNGFANEIIMIMIENTLFYPILKRFDIHTNWYREKIVKNYNDLSKFINSNNKNFIFLHSMPPHPPYLFDKNGELPINNDLTWGYSDISVSNYIGQLEFINKKILNSLKKIIRNSKNPPIIIIQGDHGPGLELMKEMDKGYPVDSLIREEYNLKERFRVLNAVYSMKSLDSLNKKNYTLVNTFRIILNEFFGSNLDLLEDESFFSTYNKPFQFFNVTEKVKY